jgi:hypothetical protein
MAEQGLPRLGARPVCREAPCGVRPDEAVRIARALAVPLRAFTELAPSPPGDGFRLSPEPTAPERGLFMRKVGRPDGLACVFRVSLLEGAVACGLDALAVRDCGAGGGTGHLPEGEAESRRSRVRARWHQAVESGVFSVIEDVFHAFLFDAYPEHPERGPDAGGGL